MREPIGDYSKAQRAIAQAAETGATTLDLSHLRDLRALPPEIAELSLTELTLGVSGVSRHALDISALNGLDTLQRLTVSHASLDLAPLIGLPNLRFLSLSSCAVEDPSVLENLPTVKTVELIIYDTPGVPAPQFNQLPRMAGLKHLSLFESTVIEPSMLADFTGLERLSLHGLYVSDPHGVPLPFDASAIGTLTGLKGLAISQCDLVDIGPLARLTSLEDLNLNENPIDDITPLSGLTGLRDLNLASTPLDDLSPLAGLTRLHTLWAPFEMPVTDLTPLKGMSDLHTLALHVTGADLSVMISMARLQELFLSMSGAQDLSVLPELKGLKRLKIYGGEAKSNPVPKEMDWLEDLVIIDLLP